MKKILAVLFACSIVLAGCMDLTDEDIDKIVDDILEIPGCNADETAYNYDVNATNNNACLTEMVLKNSIADFITLMDNGPGQDQTMGMSMTGSGDMEGQQMDWTSVNVYSPDGSYTSMELDLGMLVWSQSQLITSAADGTTLMQVNHNGAQMLMNSATDFSSWNSMDDDDMGDDDMDMGDNDMGGNDMDNDNMEMSLPEVEVPADFDPSTALFEAGLATDNGYSFSTTMDDGMGYSMTMTFTLGMDLVVNSMTLTETMDGESSTSSITMLEESILMGYLTIDSTLPYQALPFGVSPMGGMGSGDNDMGDNVDWEPYYGGYCEWEGDSGDEANVWYCKDDESDNDWDTWWYYCELHDGDWHCTDDFGQSSDYENSADLEQYDADEGHDHGDDVPDNFYVDAFLTDNWANSLNDYADPEFTINAGFEDVDNVQFDLYDSDGMEITTLTILPSDFTDQGDGNMIYYVDIDHLMVDEGCYTLTATVTSYDNNYQGEWIRDDICIYDTGNDDDGSDDSNVDEWEFDCTKFVDTNYVINDENGAPSFDDSWNAEGLDYITNLCDNQDANNPDTYQIDSSHAGYWGSTDITGWFIDGENNIIESMNWIFVNNGVYIVNQGSDDCDGVYDADADTCTEDTGVTVTDSDELLMIWSLEDEDGNVLNNKILYQFNFQTKSGVMAAIVMKENTFMCDDGEEISYEYVNDGEEDCLGGEDEGSNDDGDDGHDDHGDDGHDDHGDNDDAPTAQDLINMTDTDGSGTMSFDEFIAYMNNPDNDDAGPDDHGDDDHDDEVSVQTQDFMNLTDDDGNGTLSLDEWIDYWNEMNNDEFEEDLDQEGIDIFTEAFEDSDYDANGEVDLNELEDLLDYIYGNSSDDNPDEYDDLNTIFDNNDADMSGDLDVNELDQFILEIDEYFMEEGNMACYDTIMEEYDYARNQTDCNDNGFIWMNLDDDHNENGIEDDYEFICDNGNIIYIDLVNNQMDDCGDWSDESNHNDNGEDQNSEDDGPPSPQSVLDMTDTDQNGLMDFDEFITFLSEDDGEESAEYMTQSVIDEFNEIFNSSDLDESDDLDLDELEQFLLDLEEYMSTSDDGHDEMWTFNREMSECDSDADGMVDFDELDACVTMDIANDGYGDEGVAEQSLRWMFDLVDADEDGMLDSDEFEDFAEMTSEEPMMLCYDRYADEIDSSVTSYEDCEAGDNNWIQALQPVNDGDDGMDNDLDDDLPSESEMFSGMDGNQDGYVNASEALIYFEQMMNDAPTPEDTMEEADYDDSGNISWNEFVINWNEDEDENDLDDYHLNNSLDLDSQLYQAFNSSDYDGSGGLNLSEVQDFIDQVVVIIETLEDDEDNDEFMSIVNSAFACTDYNADDMLDSNEFSAYYSGIFGEMNLEMMLCYMDLDQSGEVSASEFAQWANQSEDSEPMSDEDWNDFLFGFEMMDTDGSGGLNADELNAVMMGDGNDDHSDDGHDDNGNHGSMFDWMISNSQDMPMEGTFDDYTIVLAMCTMDESSDDGMDMGMGTTPAMNCGDDVLSVTIADAMAQDAVVMFHDADMSGTITGGDMVHISPDIDVDGDWNMVRLYSTSADSYSDENPMLTPGFTGALGMLALLGAALLTRRD